MDWDAQRSRYPWAFPPDDTANWAWHVHAFLIRHAGGSRARGHGHRRLRSAPVRRRGAPRCGARGEWGRPRGGAARDPDASPRRPCGRHLSLPDGGPRFPNARYHVHPADWTYFGEHRTPDDFTGRFAMAGLEELGAARPRSRRTTRSSPVCLSDTHPGTRPGIGWSGSTAVAAPCSSSATSSTHLPRSRIRAGDRTTTRTRSSPRDNGRSGSRGLVASGGRSAYRISVVRSVTCGTRGGHPTEASMPPRLRLESIPKSGASPEAARASHHPLRERTLDHVASCPDHGSRGSRLPQLQRRLSRRPHAPRSSRSPRRRSRTSTTGPIPAELAGSRYPNGHPDPRGGRAHPPDRRAATWTTWSSPTPTSRTST